jgi:rhodanese-related sulfurtransferase
MTFRNSLHDRPVTLTDTTPDPARVAEGRAFRRLHPAEAHAALDAGALLLDIRRAAARRADGEVPGSLVVSGPVREWRLGPDSPVRVADVRDRAVIVIGDGCHGSVLAASALAGLGVREVTDVIGGFPAWCDAGLPVTRGFTLAGRTVPPQRSRLDARVPVPA